MIKSSNRKVVDRTEEPKRFKMGSAAAPKWLNKLLGHKQGVRIKMEIADDSEREKLLLYAFIVEVLDPTG